MKKSTLILTVLALLLYISSIGFAYFAGHRNGQREALRREVAGSLAITTALYRSLERGDVDRAKQTAGMMVYGTTRSYEALFPEFAATNQGRHIQYAREISNQMETNLVPASSILTNFPHTTDAKVDVTQEQD